MEFQFPGASPTTEALVTLTDSADGKEVYTMKVSLPLFVCSRGGSQSAAPAAASQVARKEGQLKMTTKSAQKHDLCVEPVGRCFPP